MAVDGYCRAGIDDVDAFYRRKFLTDEHYDALAAGQDFRHHVDYAKVHWVLANLAAQVPAGARVLDVGCGCGVLNLLQAAGYELSGADLSPLNCARAAANGYAAVVAADVGALPWPAAHFDAVVSLDLVGHIPFEAKDRVVAEWRRVLKPGGLQLHGIECHPLDYDAMSPEALAAFVAVDGHVGVEDQRANESRFRSHFANVASQFQFSLAMPWAEVLKQHEQYPALFTADPYLVNQLRRFSSAEVRAWNLAMGFVFQRIFDIAPRSLPDRWGFLLLRASDAPLGADAVGLPALSRLLRPIRFGTATDAYHIIDGLHDAEVEGHTGRPFRWTMGRARLLAPAAARYALTLGSTRLPGAPPAAWRIAVNGGERVTQARDIDSETIEVAGSGAHDEPATIEITATPFAPRELGLGDDRLLGVRLYALDWV